MKADKAPTLLPPFNVTQTAKVGRTPQEASLPEDFDAKPPTNGFVPDTPPLLLLLSG